MKTQEDYIQEEAEARRRRPQRIGTVVVAVFMLACLILLADTLWPFLPERGEFIVGAFVGIVVCIAVAGKFIWDIVDLKRR